MKITYTLKSDRFGMEMEIGLERQKWKEWELKSDRFGMEIKRILKK